jgi:hypothetical protein
MSPHYLRVRLSDVLATEDSEITEKERIPTFSSAPFAFSCSPFGTKFVNSYELPTPIRSRNQYQVVEAVLRGHFHRHSSFSIDCSFESAA